LKVSKRKWATMGAKQMYLVRIGSNVTALREFTALCRVETLPMKRYLLGQHLQQQTQPSNTKTGAVVSSSSKSSQHLLDQMGGTQALGKGFIEYARRKFNASQLTAIAASANQYGDGGFTLIKGPPGECLRVCLPCFGNKWLLNNPLCGTVLFS
jgi:hypothetical protein